MGSAVDGLEELYALLAPDDWTGEGYRELGFLQPFISAFFYLVSRPVYWLLLLQAHLFVRDAQRAEYLADAMAARAAGGDAVISLHEKFLLEPVFGAATQHAAQGDGGGRDLFDELAVAAAAVPERERERRRLAARLEQARLGDLHPPTGKRIQLLEGRPRGKALVSLDRARSAQIDAELMRLRAPLQQRLVDEYRDSLHY